MHRRRFFITSKMHDTVSFTADYCVQKLGCGKGILTKLVLTEILQNV